MYPSVMLDNDYPVGKSRTFKDVPLCDVSKYFGLIKAVVYNDGSVPVEFH